MTTHQYIYSIGAHTNHEQVQYTKDIVHIFPMVLLPKLHRSMANSHSLSLSLSLSLSFSLSCTAKPNSSNLTLIKWKNKRGEVQEFRVKQSIFHRWRQVGDLVVPRQDLEVWEKRKTDKESCEAVLSYWLDNPPRHYPATWEGLYELLNDSKLGQVAIDVKQAVDNAI